MSEKDESNEDKIRELEEQIRRLKEEGKEEGGVSKGALRGLGNIIPGFGELVKGLEKSEAFQERLKSTDAEIERQIKNTPPPNRAEETRESIIPPKTTLKSSKSTLKKEGEQPPQREVTVDILDEGDHLEVIAEMPGVNEEDINVEVKDKLLILFAQAGRHRYYKEVELPCSVKDELNSIYKNGILQLTIKK